MEPSPFFANGIPRGNSDFFRVQPRLVSLDFDGTLAPIAPTPDAASMPGVFRRVLRRLTRLKATRVAILSGRSLPDLKRKVRMEGIVLVGNHGLAFDPGALGWGRAATSRWNGTAREVCERLQPLLKEWPGALLEAKGPDVSLHYRRAHPEDTRRLLPEAARLLEGLPIDLRHGKCVLEFRPKGAPDKGDALERLADRFLRGKPSRGACFHVGDDRTDEDAFRALRRMDRPALGLRVGAGPSRAQYRLRNTFEVLQFLNLFKNQDEGR